MFDCDVWYTLNKATGEINWMRWETGDLVFVSCSRGWIAILTPKLWNADMGNYKPHNSDNYRPTAVPKKCWNIVGSVGEVWLAARRQTVGRAS